MPETFYTEYEVNARLWHLRDQIKLRVKRAIQRAFVTAEINDTTVHLADLMAEIEEIIHNTSARADYR